MQPNTKTSALLRWAIAPLVLSVSFATSPADAAHFRVLHSFCKKLNCGDGNNPAGSLAIDRMGNLYGTAEGGAHGQGIVFELSAPTVGRRWVYRVLYHFCALSNCADGSNPETSTLVVDTNGNVYGMTYTGGAGNDTGTVFELSPPKTGHRWTLRTIYSFCAAVSSCHDGENPIGGLTYAGREAGAPYDDHSRLYGTTDNGGSHFGGVAFSLKPDRKGNWSQHVLYAFCQVHGATCTDGFHPRKRLTMDSAGNFYGSTISGGSLFGGVVFKLSPQAGERKMSESVLFNLCEAPCNNATSASELFLDSGGDLFGTSNEGGNDKPECGSFGCGLLFQIAAGGKETTTYEFCSQTACRDGDLPSSAPIPDASGNLYGTTGSGGAHNAGTVYRWSGSLHVLHSFCEVNGCPDGSGPGGVTMSSNGEIFGTTFSGGAYNGGTVFELTP